MMMVVSLYSFAESIRSAFCRRSIHGVFVLFEMIHQVDLLAVTIGNVHGTYRLPPQLDFPRLRAIQHALMTEVSRSHQPPKQPQPRLLQVLIHDPTVFWSEALFCFHHVWRE